MLVQRGPGSMDECPKPSWTSIYLTQPAILARVQTQSWAGSPAGSHASQEVAGSPAWAGPVYLEFEGFSEGAIGSGGCRRQYAVHTMMRWLRILPRGAGGLSTCDKLCSAPSPWRVLFLVPFLGQRAPSAACGWRTLTSRTACRSIDLSDAGPQPQPTNALLCRCTIYSRGPLTTIQGFQIPSRLALVPFLP